VILTALLGGSAFFVQDKQTLLNLFESEGFLSLRERSQPTTNIVSVKSEADYVAFKSTSHHSISFLISV
jgi:hypothetical protein